MEEKWLPVEGYDGYYEVSNRGEVRTKKKTLRKHAMSNGYFNVSLFKNGKYKAIGIHRLVAIAFIPNPDNLPQVNHKDGNKHNNEVSNLEWATCSENISHAYNTGLKENCREHCRKLGKRGSPEQKAYIEAKKRKVISVLISSEKTAEHESSNQAARDTGCDLAAVFKILNKKQKQTKGYCFYFKEE